MAQDEALGATSQLALARAPHDVEDRCVARTLALLRRARSYAKFNHKHARNKTASFSWSKLLTK